MGGGGQKRPPLFWVENHESFVFFDFEPKKCFRVRTLWALYGAEWDERFMHFPTIFAMLAVLATSVALWYPL